jgi:NADH:ubiquinone oxidoreductase subunit 2 (subunit N)
LLNYLNNFYLLSYKEYIFSLLLLNVTVYLILLFNLFFIFFLFDVKYIKTLSELKFIGNVPSISIYVVIILMSFAGVPPLLGFSGKFLIFIAIFSKSNWLFLFFFGVVNIFLIYFYIQNFRFLSAKRIYDKALNSYNLTHNNTFVNILVYLNFFNLFSIFFIEELIIFFNSVSSNMFI